MLVPRVQFCEPFLTSTVAATGTREKNLPLARQTIDLLAMLQDKTRGNLSGDEERVLSQAIYDLRMRFVEVAKDK